jgi:hypothetical protein
MTQDLVNVHLLAGKSIFHIHIVDKILIVKRTAAQKQYGATCSIDALRLEYLRLVTALKMILEKYAAVAVDNTCTSNTCDKSLSILLV